MQYKPSLSIGYYSQKYDKLEIMKYRSLYGMHNVQA